jgi:hypothetical protein
MTGGWEESTKARPLGLPLEPLWRAIPTPELPGELLRFQLASTDWVRSSLSPIRSSSLSCNSPMNLHKAQSRTAATAQLRETELTVLRPLQSCLGQAGLGCWDVSSPFGLDNNRVPIYSFSTQFCYTQASLRDHLGGILFLHLNLGKIVLLKAFGPFWFWLMFMLNWRRDGLFCFGC